MTDADRCVYCGEIVPEGRQVCPACEVKRMEDALKRTDSPYLKRDYLKGIRRLKRLMKRK